jgi:hypothetical protein
VKKNIADGDGNKTIKTTEGEIDRWRRYEAGTRTNEDGWRWMVDDRWLTMDKHRHIVQAPKRGINSQVQARRYVHIEV